MTSTRIALIFPTAQVADAKRREFEVLGVEKQYHCVYPLMSITGLRFSNVFVSDVTNQSIIRGSTMVRKWFHEHVMTRLDVGAQIIVLP